MALKDHQKADRLKLWLQVSLAAGSLALGACGAKVEHTAQQVEAKAPAPAVVQDAPPGSEFDIAPVIANPDRQVPNSPPTPDSLAQVPEPAVAADPAAGDSPATPPTPIAADPAIPAAQPLPSLEPRLAPAGVFYLTTRISLPTANGIRALVPGTRVTVKKQMDRDYLVTDGTTDLQVNTLLLTNDLNYAAKLQRHQAELNRLQAEQNRQSRLKVIINKDQVTTR